MQILLTKSFELGETFGLDVVNGEVKKKKSSRFRIPHVGWSKIKIIKKNKFLKMFQIILNYILTTVFILI